MLINLSIEELEMVRDALDVLAPDSEQGHITREALLFQVMRAIVQAKENL
jgi:hypothetical protein